MSANTFGKIFRITTFGESHGPGLGVVIDGVPPLLAINESDIQKELDRRKPGQSQVSTARKEADKVEILSGVFEGKSTGASIALLIRNKGQKSEDYQELKDVFRPGHADYTYWKKYGIRDYRGGGRSSGRETAARVAAGAIAKKILAEKGIKITAYTISIDNIFAEKIDFEEIEKNPIRCPDPIKAREMLEYIEKVKAEGDSTGCVIETVVQGCPVGLGEPVFDKLDAVLAQGIMSIGAVKGIEFGAGFKASKLKGSENNDQMYYDGKRVRTHTNNAGGILGGISNGEAIMFKAAIKPTASIAKPQETVDINNKSKTIKVKGRHDPCICPRIVPVIEAMTALVLVDFLLIFTQGK